MPPIPLPSSPLRPGSNTIPSRGASQQEQVTAPIQKSSRSSPIKYANKPIGSLETVEESAVINDSDTYEEDSEFLLHHLSPLPNDWVQPQGHTLVAQIKDAGTISEHIYTPFSQLLNQYSQSLHKLDVVQKHSNVPAHPYVFLPRFRDPPADHPVDFRDKADIVVAVGPASRYEVAPGCDYPDVKFHEIISLIECKPMEEKEDNQVDDYLFELLEARPDMPGVFGLALLPHGYEILWSDASGVIGSGEYRWEDLVPLASYVFSLYVPPPGHHLWDTTLKPSLKPCSSTQDEDDSSPNPTTEQHAAHKMPRKLESLSWDLMGRDGGHLTFERCVIGDPWGRRTDIYQHVGEDGQIMMMKDAYWDTNRRYNELECLKMIHKDGIFPGVVRILPCEVPDIKTAQRATGSFVREPEKVKTRMLMASYGVGFEQAETVLDLLMATYDINEVHRGLVNQKNVLHRDISEFNVLMYPKHHHSADGKLMQNPPVFIRQVLNPTASQEDDVDMSAGLLIDFDNSAYTKDTNFVKPKCCTGTPRFIARSVASGQVLSDNNARTYVPMPHLSPEAAQVYIRSYGQRTYDDYQDSGDTVHGRLIPPRPARGAARPTYFHRPDHDVESIFWALLSSLLHAQPKEIDPHAKDNLRYYEEASDVLDRHIIAAGSIFDGRELLLSFSEEGLERALDPKLWSLTEMLYLMIGQIRPEYAFLDPPPAEDHLHEAMRRLLLEQIVKMQASGDPIPLIPGCSRRTYYEETKIACPVKRKPSHESGQSTRSKGVKAQNYWGTTRETNTTASYGVGFDQAESVLDLLLATYDIIEVHRELVNQRRVLHRDISEFDLLMYPRRQHPANSILLQNPPLFIQQVLNSTASQQADLDKPVGLLIDFDNSAYPKETDFVKTKCRTGTPRFIARSVASGQVLLDDHAYVPMPGLSPAAEQVYIRAYGQKSYDNYQDVGDKFHGRDIPPRLARGVALPAYFHRPDHDVESIFWVLLSSLLHAQPKEIDPHAKVNLRAYQEASDMLDRHVIEADAENDGRDRLLTFSDVKFERALHPQLRSLAEMLHLMMYQIRPEYAFLDPPPAADHLHEAMRRLLLEQIVKMQASGDSIPLIPGCSRRTYRGKESEKETRAAAPVKRKPSHQSGRSIGNKRATAHNYWGTTGETDANKNSFKKILST
ncbi:hypothetical protein NLI96_g9971 [Meripilus lineatus]|uniref:Fungal-type protein kinase domain-containing protein n=1 Tax=Meripilus lineatus TaxID=2056292 RepID=A0AAD5UUI8_9APHY|nr:hypothetical protein NLI96_g9971 [Physisporinus lineatus]